MKDARTRPKAGIWMHSTKYYLVLLFSVLAALIVFSYTQGLHLLARVIIGIVYMMFLPGFFLCSLIFPDDGETIFLERVGLSLGLSIPLALSTILFMDTVLKIPITTLNIVEYLGLLMVFLLFAIFLSNWLSKRNH
jgi:uncharacterized membrane protein